MKNGLPWDDQELEIAVRVYLFLLNLEELGIQYSLSDVMNPVLNELLVNRNEASVRYRMRNISFIMSQNNQRILSAYSPAAQVGSNVQKRIKDILHPLLSVSGLLKRYDKIHAAIEKPSNNTAVEKIAELTAKLDSSESVGIGHNNPPPSSESENLINNELRCLRSEVEDLKQLLVQNASKDRINKKQSCLINIGLKLFVWIGARITKASDAAMVPIGVAAGGTLIAKITDTLPLLFEILHIVFGTK